MMKGTFPGTLAVLLAAAVGPVLAEGSKVTLQSLVRQMTDLALLAEFPDPPYVAKQFSSYDRNSEDPKAESWWANHDCAFMLYDGTIEIKTPYYKTGPQQGRPPDGYFEARTKVGLAPNRPATGSYVWAYTTAPDGGPINGRIPQGYVEKSAIKLDPQGRAMAEMDGPGCVTRIWSANPGDGGKIRIYLDHAAEPVIEAPMAALLGGTWKTKIDGKEVIPFPGPIACETSRGYNLYFPIPYQKHCKITLEKPAIYYHVDYRVYPKGTEVETFSLKTFEKNSGLTTKVIEQLGRSQPTTVFRNKFEKWNKATLNPGANEWEGVRYEGSSILIEELNIEVAKCENMDEILHGLVLVGKFDGADRPQIWCPMDEFYGGGLGGNDFISIVQKSMRRVDNGKFYWAGWCMPVEKSAVFQIHNYSKYKADVRLMVSYDQAPYTWTDRSMHFHAKYRQSTMNTRPFRDWTYCNLKGKGVFAGGTLSIFNPVPDWWGEGDEKIYVDGEKFPSWFGTGTEDYYGYAWCWPKLFQHAYHNQTRCDGPGNRGHTTVNRFHILDAIPYQKDFKFDMEVWHWRPNIDVQYGSTSYWYARPGGSDDFPPVDPKVLQVFPTLPPPYKVQGILEGEKLRILKKSSDFELDPQDLNPHTFGRNRWSGDCHLWGRPLRAGEWTDLELPVKADGKYHVVVYLTKARDYGIVQFHLDGKPLGKPIDGFNSPQVISTGPIDLGVVDLKKGQAVLRVEVIGTNPKSVGMRHMFGLDGVLLKQ